MVMQNCRSKKKKIVTLAFLVIVTSVFGDLGIFLVSSMSQFFFIFQTLRLDKEKKNGGQKIFKNIRIQISTLNIGENLREERRAEI